MDTIEEILSDGSGSAQLVLRGGHVLANDWPPDGHLVFMDFAEGFPGLAVHYAGDTALAPAGCQNDWKRSFQEVG